MSEEERATQSRRRTITICLALVYFIWGTTYLGIRVAIAPGGDSAAGFPPFFMSGTRFLVAGPVFFIILLVRGASLPTQRQWLAALPMGVLMFSFGNGIIAFAEMRISSGIAAVVAATSPLWVAALGLLFRERTTSREWFALVVGFVGVVVLASGDALHGDWKWIGFLALAPIGWSTGSLLAKRLPLAPGPMGSATGMAWGGVANLGISAMLGEPWRISSIALSSWVAWAYLGVFGSVVAYTAFLYLLRNARPAVAMTYAYVNPVIAVMAGAVLLGEKVGASTILALALIASATGLLILRRRT